MGGSRNQRAARRDCGCGVTGALVFGLRLLMASAAWLYMMAAPGCVRVRENSELEGRSPGSGRMRISFERSGGFAGMRLRGTIDSDTLPPEEARKLREMVDAAGFFDLPPSITTEKPGPDRFQYKLTIETESRRHTVFVEEEVASKELRALLSYVTMLARKK